ncbi:MAG: glyoxalase/bleomycin resistance/dioxygenase family protein [Pseudomonadota bacterium]
MKLHVSFKVADIETGIDFYSKLFAQSPVITRSDYAKWDLDDPAVNFVIETASDGRAGFDHIGIQTDDADQLQTISQAMKKTEQEYIDIEQAHCCYAKSDKSWVRGIANEAWEVFHTHEHDSDEYGSGFSSLKRMDGSNSCCS